MTENYNFENIRTLLSKGFSEDELRNDLCYFEPAFNSFYERLPQSAPKAQIIQQLVEFANQRLKVESLLTWAKKYNPARYELHQPYGDSPTPPPQLKTPQQHEIKINLPGLLKMLGSNIYAEPDMVVREMIQNAHDTCIIRQAKERNFVAPQIHIAYDWAARTLTFSDNGAGMTEAELHNYLATIGAGLTKLERENLQGLGAQEAFLLIGQFGIGMLSAFSVANRVEVFTRSYQSNSPGLKWVCEGDIHYTVEAVAKAEVGTHLVLHLNDKSLVLLADEGGRLKQIIKKYADLISIPIFLKNHGQVNNITPPWQQGQQSDLDSYLFERYGLHAIEIIRLNDRQPMHLEGLLFVPLTSSELARDFGEVDIYIARVFITERDKGLLPPWARFIKGVINSTALTPTISRDAVVKDETYQHARAILSETILSHLEGLAQTEVGAARLDLIVGAYNNLIKAGALQDDAFFRRIAPLVRVATESGQMSMRQYLINSGGVIYYLSERGNGAIHNLLKAEKKLIVIDASWGVEEEFLEKYARLFGVAIKRLEMEPDLLVNHSAEVDDKWHELETQFKLTVGVETQAIAFDPATVPALLIDQPQEKEVELTGLSAGDLYRAFERLKQRKAEQDQKFLRLNMKNKLMQELRLMNCNETFKLALTAIYNNALLLAQPYLPPADLERVFTVNNAAFTTMIQDSRRVEEMKSKIAQMEMEFGEQIRWLEAQKAQGDIP